VKYSNLSFLQDGGVRHYASVGQILGRQTNSIWCFMSAQFGWHRFSRFDVTSNTLEL